MKGYWTDTRPNGQSIEPGTFCWVTDPENGTNPIYTYGKTQEDVIRKLSLTNAHAQTAIARRNMTPAPAAPAQAALPVAPIISPDQIMRATQDLENPAKAGEAITTLVQAHTGIDLNRLALDAFGRLAAKWEQDNPDFFPHEGNRRLIAGEAQALAGGNLAKVAEAHLSQAFLNLKARGFLFEPETDSHNQQPPTPPFPDESQVQLRPRGTRFATGARSAGFQRQTPSTTRAPKYTEAEIRNMSLAKSRQLIDSNDPDYAYACDFYFGPSKATA